MVQGRTEHFLVCLVASDDWSGGSHCGHPYHQLHGDVVEEEALPACHVLPAILELPRAHQQQLATGTGVEELLVGLVGGILRDALRKEGNEGIPLLHHSPRYGSLARTDTRRDRYHAVLTSLEHLGFQGFHSGLRHRARALYLHTLRSFQQAKVANGAEGDRLGRWCGASWSCGTLSIWLRVRDRLQQALYRPRPATAASCSALCQHRHRELDAAHRVEVLAVLLHHPEAPRVVTAVVDHPLQLPLPEEDAVVEAWLEDEADLGVGAMPSSVLRLRR